MDTFMQFLLSFKMQKSNSNFYGCKLCEIYQPKQTKNGIILHQSIGIIMYNKCITEDKQATFRSKWL